MQRTYYNDEYQGTGTASETVGLDFKFVNENGGLRCFVRQNNGPSSSNLVNRTSPLTSGYLFMIINLQKIDIRMQVSILISTKSVVQIKYK